MPSMFVFLFYLVFLVSPAEKNYIYKYFSELSVLFTEVFTQGYRNEKRDCVCKHNLMLTEFEITVRKGKTSQTYTGLFGDEMPVAAKLTKKNPAIYL